MVRRFAIFPVLAVLLMAINLLAGNATTDWTVGYGGTVSFDGSSTLAGTNLAASSLEGVGTPQNPGDSLSITNGALGFSDSAWDGPGTWTWGAGGVGTLSITGCIATVTGCSTNVVLLSDEFDNVTVAPLNGTTFQITFGQIEGTINSAVASYFGIGDTFSASSIQLTLSDPSDPSVGSAFSSTNMGGTINAVAAVEDWTLASSLIFFAAVLGLFAALTRKKVLQVALQL